MRGARANLSVGVPPSGGEERLKPELPPGLFIRARSDPMHRVKSGTIDQRPHEGGHYKTAYEQSGLAGKLNRWR